MDQQKGYYEGYWSKGGIISGPQLDDKKDFIAKNAGFNNRILDIGCGNGYVSSILISQNEVIGLDLSRLALMQAKMVGLNTVLSDLTILPFKDRSFDVVLALDILEHLFDPVSLLKEANRVLRKDGILLISVPNASNIATRFLFLLKGDINDMADINDIRNPDFIFSEHIRFFSDNKIKKAIKSTGFEVEIIQYYLQPYFVTNQKFNMLRKIVTIMCLQKIFPVLFSTWFFIVCRKYNINGIPLYEKPFNGSYR